MANQTPPEYGGGACYRNQRRLANVNINVAEATSSQGYNSRAPQMSGTMEVTKEMAKMLLEKFKAGETKPSTRERTKGQQVVKMDVGANIGSSTNALRDGNQTGGYFYFWFRDEYVPQKKEEPPVTEDISLDDEIPF